MLFRSRVAVEPLGHQCYQVNVHFGFKDDRDIPQALQLCKQQGLAFEPMETSYFIARQTVILSVGSGMALWRESLSATMSRNARDAADFFRLPTTRVIAVGAQLEL